MYFFLLLGLVLFIPEFAHAEPSLLSIVTALTGVIGSFVKAGLAVALLVFVWGVATTMIGMNGASAGSEKAITEGKSRMIWGIVGLFVVVSVWGLVALLGQIVGVSNPSSSVDTPVFEY